MPISVPKVDLTVVGGKAEVDSLPQPETNLAGRDSSSMAKKAAAKSAKPSKRSVVSNTAAKRNPKLLSGGNPQIAKADGDVPVQAFIAAMPGWKQDVGRRLDALVERTVPNVRKAVRWNTPFYGIEGQGWFLAFHCITKYVKVAFLNGTSLTRCLPSNPKTKGRAICTSMRLVRSTQRL